MHDVVRGLIPRIHVFQTQQQETKTWMAGTQASKATPFFERLCPAMTIISMNPGKFAALLMAVRIVDDEQRGVGLLGGVEVVDRDGGVVALRIRNGPLA